MGAQQDEPRWFRVAFGRPRIRNGVVWLVLAACWFATTIAGGSNPWGYLVATLWALVGAMVLGSAIRDFRRGRGAYARPVLDTQD